MNRQAIQNGVNELRLGDLPGFPRFYADYAECAEKALRFYRCSPDIESMATHARIIRPGVSFSGDFGQILQSLNCSKASPANLNRLQDPEIRIVWVTQPASLFGGAFTQILKCVTAIKLADELGQRGIPTIPVCEIGPGIRNARDRCTLNLLDIEGTLQKLVLRNIEAHALAGGEDFLIPPHIKELFARIGPMVSNLPGSDTLQLLKELYHPGTLLSAASEHFWAKLFADHGLVVLNFHGEVMGGFLGMELKRLGITPVEIAEGMRRREEDLAQSGYEIQGEEYSSTVCDHPQILPFLRHAVLPVVAVIADPDEMELMGLLGPIYDKLGIIQPVVWPRASASVINGRTQKILERYHVSYVDALCGKKEVRGWISSDAGGEQAINQFRSLSQRIRDKMDVLRDLSKADDHLKKSVDSCGEKMLYQINKLIDRLDASSRAKRAAFERRSERLFNELLPAGLLQEQGLSAAHFLFHYSAGMIQNLGQRLDVLRHRHQLIFAG
jgi:uncharacterized protein YllA (UPF0747 family)